MLRCTAHNHQGYTLAEILVAFAMFGILSALALPSLVGLLNRQKVNSAFNDLRAALFEAQAAAAKTSSQCIVTVSTGSDPVTVKAVDPQNKPCIVNRTLQQGVKVSENYPSSGQIVFSLKGNTTDEGTLVLYWASQPSLQKKCIVTSLGIGIIRSGDYTGDPQSANAANCKTTP
jgi:prepilin-type N-terminal cleavage/methylation domain-containing protein